MHVQRESEVGISSASCSPLTLQQKKFIDHCEVNKISLSSVISVLGGSIENFCSGDTVLVLPPPKRFKAEYRSSASRTLLANLELADSIFNHVIKKVPYSVNYLSRNFKANKPEHSKICKDLGWKWMETKFASSSQLERLHKLEKIGVAVCEELAYIAKIHAMQKYPNRRVDCVGIGGGRHTVLAIGIAKNNDPRNYKTWGKDFVICDIWAGKFYPGTKLKKELYDYLGVVQDTMNSEISYPLVRPFNSKRQILVALDLPLSEKEIKQILPSTKEKIKHIISLAQSEKNKIVPEKSNEKTENCPMDEVFDTQSRIGFDLVKLYVEVKDNIMPILGKWRGENSHENKALINLLHTYKDGAEIITEQGSPDEDAVKIIEDLNTICKLMKKGLKNLTDLHKAYSAIDEIEKQIKEIEIYVNASHLEAVKN